MNENKIYMAGYAMSEKSREILDRLPSDEESLIRMHNQWCESVGRDDLLIRTGDEEIIDFLIELGMEPSEAHKAVKYDSFAEEGETKRIMEALVCLKYFTIDKNLLTIKTFFSIDDIECPINTDVLARYIAETGDYLGNEPLREMMEDEQTETEPAMPVWWDMPVAVKGAEN